MSDLYRQAMEATDQATADRIFEQCVQQHLKARPQDDRERAEFVQRSNLGYFAGYYDSETRRRVEKLFKAVHPVFGSIEKHGEPSADLAFKMGQVYGGNARKDNDRN